MDIQLVDQRGNVRWEPCGVPWEKKPTQCALCKKWHGTTAKQRLT